MLERLKFDGGNEVIANIDRGWAVVLVRAIL